MVLPLGSSSTAVWGGVWETFLGLLGSMRVASPNNMRSWSEIWPQEEEERLFDAKERFFGKEEAEVILWRDSAGWCPFCFATVLLLEEMRVAYAVKTIPLRAYARPGETKDPAYLKMVPDGVVPGLQHRGKDGTFEPAFRNAYAIFRDLRESFPERYPLGDATKHDAIVSMDGIAGQLERAQYRRDPETVRKPLEALNDLISGPWVCGEEFSAADCFLLPFLERIEAYTMYFHGKKTLETLNWYPKMATLLETARSRCDTYRDFGGDAHSLAHIVLKFHPDLPISDDAKTIDTPDKNRITKIDAKIAALKLAKNHQKVTAFAARTAGFVTDDSKKNDDDLFFENCLEDALLCVANGLLDTPTSFDYSPAAKNLLTKNSRCLPKVAHALRALSLNVGVPRDFAPGPANALRAHLSGLSDALFQQVLSQ